ncbi:MAG: MFS transporter [Bacteroidales bacterium]|nr:MFS transporter [Bacteroidales bacterium]
MTRLSEKIGYGFGDFASSLFWKIFSYFLPFFYVSIFGLHPAHAALLILITKLYDALSDPVMGLICDRTQTKWGKYRPYLLWVAFPFAVCGVLMFYTPPVASYTFKLVYAYVTYLLMMTAYSAINVPYAAMLGVLATDPHEKSEFAAFRMFFAYIGSFVSMGIFAVFEEHIKGTPRLVDGHPLLDANGNPVLIQTVKEASPMQFTNVVFVVAVLALILFLLSFRMTREHVHIDNDGSKGSVGEDLKALLQNGPWWLLIVASICYLIMGSLRGGAAVYYFSDIMGENALFGSVIFLAIGELAQLSGVPLAVPLSDRLGRKNTAILAFLWIAFFSLPVTFFPSSAAGFWALLVCHVMVCLGIGVAAPLMWAMFSDVADYVEEQSGVASIGLVFASSSMAQKLGCALGSALVAAILGMAGYEEGVLESSVAIDRAVRAMMGYLPAISTVIGVAALLLYPLTPARMQSVRSRLSSRRSTL